MTRRATLFLVCAFEIALLMFVVAWSVLAETHLAEGKETEQIIVHGQIIATSPRESGGWDFSIIYKQNVYMCVQGYAQYTSYFVQCMRQK